MATWEGSVGFGDKIIPAACSIKSWIVLDDPLQHRSLCIVVVQGIEDDLTNVAYMCDDNGFEIFLYNHHCVAC